MLKKILFFFFLFPIFYSLFTNSVFAQTQENSWYMAGANPQRTSWTPEEVSAAGGSKLIVEWYRPIEAYIPQNVQAIASGGLLYISTAKGLYALDAVTGDLRWRYDTELPLGNSPTIYNGIAYVGGLDKRLHAIDAGTGQRKWVYDNARGGFYANPLVSQVNGKTVVFTGNRDGTFYAIENQGTTAKLLWSYQTQGPILLSSACKYDNSTNTCTSPIFFASNDSYAYALNPQTGSLVWKSPQKLPGERWHSYWPVIYQDKVIFSAAVGYRQGRGPGIMSLNEPFSYGAYSGLQQVELERDYGFTTEPIVQLPGDPWAGNKTIVDLSPISEYLEDKPWRHTTIILNQTDGREYIFDADNDGKLETIAIGYWGTRSGNSYPPIVHQNGDLYINGLYRNTNSRGQVIHWKDGSRYFSLEGGKSAIDEPQAISFGGNIIYRNLCCDRVADFVNIVTGITGRLWGYGTSLAAQPGTGWQGQAPEYDEMWWGIEWGLPRLEGWYGGKCPVDQYPCPINLSPGRSGVYHNHGDQNPIVPYQGRLYTHRSNGIIAYGPGPAQNPAKKNAVLIQPKTETIKSPSVSELKQRLEAEIAKMMGDLNKDGVVDIKDHLRPGYYNNGQADLKEFVIYFENPADTLYTLSTAYPHLSPQLQAQAKGYLDREYTEYFSGSTTMYINSGWKDRVDRTAFPIPPEVEADMQTFAKSTRKNQGTKLNHPQFVFYALWKYTQVLTGQFTPNPIPLPSTDPNYQLVQTIYTNSKNNLRLPATLDDNYISSFPFYHNELIAGYIGFLKLQEMADKTVADSTLRTNVTDELNRLLSLRASNLSVVNNCYPNYDHNTHCKTLNIGRNFIYLVPETSNYLRQNALSKVQTLVNELSYVVPYWSVSAFESTHLEGVMQNLYDVTLLQGKAQILQEPYEELVKYLDVPAFERGDLLYINNLVSTIEAPSSSTITPLPTQPPTLTPTPSPTHCTPLGDINCSGKVDILDLSALLSKFGTTDAKSDLNNSGRVDILDLSLLLSNFGKTQAGATPTPTIGVSTPTPTQGVSPTNTPVPLSGVITNIVVSTGRQYEVDTLSSGKLLYTDRTYTFNSPIPVFLNNQEYIKTANSDKSAASSNYLTFTISKDVTVYILYDDRVTTLPAFLSDGTWTILPDTVSTTDGTRRIYQKSFPQGTITLAGSSQPPMSGANSNYSVVVVP